MGLADLQGLTGQVLDHGAQRAIDRARPDRRRPPLPEPATLRIQVDLVDAKPPIWRRLDLYNDLTLDAVHQVLQVAFDWTDSHLHRFSLGGGPFDPTSQLLLCPFDVDEGADDGLPAAGVRLDETLQQPGDQLHYIYDYGDNWELTLQLIEVRPPSEAPAVAVAGARAAPPEDSGGGTDLAALSSVLPDPAAVDLDGINQGLRSAAAFFAADPRVTELRARLAHLPIGSAIVAALGTQLTTPSDDELRAVLGAHLWFLDRAADGGIPLTSAGYLTPDNVRAAAAVVPGAADWIGKQNREAQTYPVLAFRESLQKLGLLRKYRGTLRLTKAGTAAQRDPHRLWGALAAALAPKKSGFDQDATFLVLAAAAGAGGQELHVDAVTEGLTAVGYRYPDGAPIGVRALSDLPALTTLVNIDDDTRGRRQRFHIHPVAADLAAAALRR